MARPLPVEVNLTRAAVGSRLRAARHAAGMTIEQVAVSTGLTKGFLSRVERDQTSPSVATLVALCEVLHQPIGELFESTGAALVRADDAPLIQLGGVDAVERLVSPRGEASFQVVRSHIEPGGNGGAEKYAVSAERELVYVLSGSLRIEFSDVTHDLKAGDSLTFPGRQPHQWHSDIGADALWVIVPAAWAGGI